MSANKRKRDEESEEEGREEVDMVDGTDDEGEPEQEKVDPTAQPKRKRGRPPGSKNKKPKLGSSSATTTDGHAPEPPKRPRGRPRKVRSAEEIAAEEARAALPKRPRGRPRKQPKPDGAEDKGEGTSTAKKRGRPKKS